MKFRIKLFTILIITLLFFKTGISQNLKLPHNPYVLVIDRYKFVSKTIVEYSPDLSNGLISPNFDGTQIKIESTKHVKAKPIYLNDDSKRLWTYLFKEDTVLIKMPTKIDTINVYDLSGDRVGVRYDTINNIKVNRIVDTINVDQLKHLINSEIQVYNGTQKMKLRAISVRLVWDNGKTFYTNYESKRIIDYPGMLKKALSLSPNGYLIMDGFWYYNLENEQDGMDGAIAWKIQ